MSTPIDHRLALPHGTLVLREHGRARADAPSWLLLHGISSGAPSWDAVAAAAPGLHLLAWDMPGYAESTPLPATQPDAAAYAEAAALALQALGIGRVHLVGHSLGALVATALAVRLGAARVGVLRLLSPARGYAADAAQAEAVRRQRLGALAEHGVPGLAARVAARLLSPAATPAQQARVQAAAARLTPHGYTQAVGLLTGSDLPALAAQGTGLAGIPRAVTVGDADVVTPPAACAALAAELGAAFGSVQGAGHALPVERPEAVAALLAGALRQGDTA